MTKAQLIDNISADLGLEKQEISATIEAFMSEVKKSLQKGDNVYLRGFGSFIVKIRAKKIGRNIKKNTPIEIPEHNTPSFKPAKVFRDMVKKGN